jgi:hypothetical protein
MHQLLLKFVAKWDNPLVIILILMGGKGALNYLPIVPKASIYVPKVMRKPVMGSNTMSETFTHMFLFRSASNFEKWPRQPNRSRMAEYVREGCVELSSHCVQSFHICPKGNLFFLTSEECVKFQKVAAW